MGAHGIDNARSRLTFLHEYGHYIDSNLPSNRAHKSNTEEGMSAGGRETAKAIDKERSSAKTI
jgi:hypothetical protein